MTAPLPALHSVEEVAEAMNVTTRYVRDKCRRREWPHSKLERGRPAFSDEQYRQVLELCRAEPQSDEPTGLSFAPRSRRAS